MHKLVETPERMKYNFTGKFRRSETTQIVHFSCSELTTLAGSSDESRSKFSTGSILRRIGNKIEVFAKNFNSLQKRYWLAKEGESSFCPKITVELFSNSRKNGSFRCRLNNHSVHSGYARNSAWVAGI